MILMIYIPYDDKKKNVFSDSHIYLNYSSIKRESSQKVSSKSFKIYWLPNLFKNIIHILLIQSIVYKYKKYIQLMIIKKS